MCVCYANDNDHYDDHDNFQNMMMMMMTSSTLARWKKRFGDGYHGMVASSSHSGDDHYDDCDWSDDDYCHLIDFISISRNNR